MARTRGRPPSRAWPRVFLAVAALNAAIFLVMVVTMNVVVGMVLVAGLGVLEFVVTRMVVTHTEPGRWRVAAVGAVVGAIAGAVVAWRRATPEKDT